MLTSTFSMLRFCGLRTMGLLATAAFAQSDSDNTMKMTISTKMQMAGPGDMPVQPLTQDAFTSKDHDMRAMRQQQNDCVVSN